MVSEPTHEYPLVSVVIPVHNAARYLPELFDALDVQSYPKERTQLIFVDNGSDDGSAGLIRRSGNLLLEEPSPGNPYRARNRGVNEAAGEIIAFLDANKIPDARWLEEGVKKLGESLVPALAGGEILFDLPPAPKAGQLVDAITFNNNRNLVVNDNSSAAGNLFVHREIWEAVGPFPGGYRSGMDINWTQRASRMGFPLLFAEKAVVRCKPRSLRNTLKKAYRVGKVHPVNMKMNGTPAGTIFAETLRTFSFPRPSEIRRGLEVLELQEKKLLLFLVWWGCWLMRIAMAAGRLRGIMRLYGSANPEYPEEANQGAREFESEAGRGSSGQTGFQAETGRQSNPDKTAGQGNPGKPGAPDNTNEPDIWNESQAQNEPENQNRPYAEAAPDSQRGQNRQDDPEHRETPAGKPSIAFIYYTFYPVRGGASVHGYNLARELSKLGYKLYKINGDPDPYTEKLSRSPFGLISALRRSDLAYIRMDYFLNFRNMAALFSLMAGKNVIVELNCPSDELRLIGRSDRYIRRIDRLYARILKRVECVVVVSEPLKRYCEEALGLDNVRLIENGGEVIDKENLNPSSAIRSAVLQIKNSFRKQVVWAGSANRMQELEWNRQILKQAGDDTAFLVIVGDEDLKFEQPEDEEMKKNVVGSAGVEGLRGSSKAGIKKDDENRDDNGHSGGDDLDGDGHSEGGETLKVDGKTAADHSWLRGSKNLFIFRGLKRDDVRHLIASSDIGLAFYGRYDWSRWGFYNSSLKVYEYLNNGLLTITNIEGTERQQRSELFRRVDSPEQAADEIDRFEQKPETQEPVRTWADVAKETDELIERVLNR